MADDAKLRRASAKQCFTRAVKGVTKAMSNNCGKDLLQSRFDILKTHWTDVQTAHEAYLQEVIQDVEETPAEYEQWFDELADVFEKIEVDVMQQLKDDSNEEQENEASELQLHKDRLYKLRGLAAVSFEEDAKDLHDLITKDKRVKTIEMIKEMRKDLKSQLKSCEKAHTEYMISLDESEAAEERNWMRVLKVKFGEVNQTCELYLQKNEVKDSGSSQKSALKMQHVQLPQFTGNVRDYPRFKSDFTKQVRPQLKSDSSAAYVLRSCLKGLALDVVNSIDDDLNEMWARLDDRFGKPSKLTDAIMNEIKRFRQLSDGDLKRFTEFVNMVEKGYRDLVRIGMEREISNSHAVSLVEEKMPERIAWEWAKEVSRRNSAVDERNKFPHLLDFLLEQRRIIEYSSSDLRYVKTSVKAHAHYVEEDDEVIDDTNCHLSIENKPPEVQQNGRRCCIHRTDNHTTPNCRVYLSLSAADRVKNIRDNCGCWSCLCIGHRSADCRYRKPCGTDGMKLTLLVLCSMDRQNVLKDQVVPVCCN